MAKKEVGPAIICFILSHAVSEVLELWKMRAQFQLSKAQSSAQKQQILVAQFERFVLYKLCITQTGLDDSAFQDTTFQQVISDVTQSLTGNAQSA